MRPFVLIELLYELIEKKHVCFKGKGPAANLKERMAAAVEKNIRRKSQKCPENKSKGLYLPVFWRCFKKLKRNQSEPKMLCQNVWIDQTTTRKRTNAVWIDQQKALTFRKRTKSSV